MTGTPARWALSTVAAAGSAVCGAYSSTSTPWVRRFSACAFWRASSPLAAWTRSLAPWSSQYLVTRSRSRCQRSSFRVSMEKPTVRGLPAPPGPALAPPASGPAFPPQAAPRASERQTAAAESKRMARASGERSWTLERLSRGDYARSPFSVNLPPRPRRSRPLAPSVSLVVRHAHGGGAAGHVAGGVGAGHGDRVHASIARALALRQELRGERPADEGVRRPRLVVGESGDAAARRAPEVGGGHPHRDGDELVVGRPEHAGGSAHGDDGGRRAVDDTHRAREAGRVSGGVGHGVRDAVGAEETGIHVRGGVDGGVEVPRAGIRRRGAGIG